MKTILIPTNFSKASEEGRDYACMLAKAFGASVTLLHIYHFTSDPGYITERYQDRNREMLKKLEARLTAICEKVKEQGIECSWLCEEGLAANDIPRICEEQKPDLVVFGSDELSLWDRLLFGTITGTLIREIKAPLLFVPKSYDIQNPKKMAFAMDYNQSDWNTIKTLIKFSEKLQSAFEIVHVADGTIDKKYEEIHFQEFRNNLTSLAGEQDIEYKLLENINIGKALREYSAEGSIDLMAVAKTKKDFFERIFSGSVSENLAQKIEIPLLIINEEESNGKEYSMGFEEGEFL